ncbi:type VII secretion system-associated protein [Streptomyces sp. HNM0663]|uniref:Type VII secretion system-associated protein n=1 Tax=Streptomyces chengmaiensis TaxID=3040919 RepID=A0ABT6HZI9_9ACTN|nr:type VII secretion system-associated protein [Streptomyces chengmaiensis]MDH2393678.1 type VII secretion system-associated protein [Streptomyces chengmaiensis]
MADSTTVNLDKAWLENFLNHDILNFRNELKKILQDGIAPSGQIVPAVASLLKNGRNPDDKLPGAELPLTIGGMVGDERTNGKALVEAVVELIEAIDLILENQKTLFEDIDDNLRTSIDKLFKTQGENLVNIEGDKLLDIFEDVDDSLGGSDDD